MGDEHVPPTPTNMYPALIWSDRRLDLRFVRDVLAFERGTSNWGLWCDDDALMRRGTIVGRVDIDDIALAPKHSILELMEKDLFLSLEKGGNSKASFLDQLEEDAQHLTSSLYDWVQTKRTEVRSRHEELMRQHDEKIEKAKSSPTIKFEEFGMDPTSGDA